MGFIELLLLAVSLSMDAFAVSVCKGLALPRITGKQACLVGAWFGGFQMLMPALGYLLGSAFAQYITSFDHWIAFVLLAVIGANMIKESRSDGEQADGVTFAFLIERTGELLFAFAIIGVTTFSLSAAGVRLGHTVGAKYKSRAELVGGVILILLGLKILLEHLGVLG